MRLVNSKEKVKYIYIIHIYKIKKTKQNINSSVLSRHLLKKATLSIRINIFTARLSLLLRLVQFGRLLCIFPNDDSINARTCADPKHGACPWNEPWALSVERVFNLSLPSLSRPLHRPPTPLNDKGSPRGGHLGLGGDPLHMLNEAGL